MEKEHWQKAHIQRARELVDRFGYAVQHVLGVEDAPGFSYTIGLTERFGHPELVICGLPPETAQEVLNRLAGRIKAGERLVAGGVDDKVFQGLPAWIGKCPEGTADRVCLLIQDVTQPGAELLQVVWPDRNGKMPWEPGARDLPQVLFFERPAPN